MSAPAQNASPNATKVSAPAQNASPNATKVSAPAQNASPNATKASAPAQNASPKATKASVKAPVASTNKSNVRPSTVMPNPKKVWVCKIVSHDGAYRLKAGKQPIHVSVNALTGDVNPVPGAPFSDAQPSFVVATNSRALCEAGLPSNPSVSVDKTATVAGLNVNGKADAGEAINYSFRVTNTGNVQLINVTVIDPRLVAVVTCSPTTLAPGASANCTPASAYLVTTADVAGGLPIINTATATGTKPGGGTVTATDTVSTPTQKPGTPPPPPAVSVSPSIVVGKDATLNDSDRDGRADAGETISYSFRVTNTGNVTLTNVTVTDPRLVAVVTCSPTTLAPGASATCTPASAYLVTAADVAGGLPIINTATATGTPPGGGTVTATDTETTRTDAPEVLGTVEEAPPVAGPVAGPVVLGVVADAPPAAVAGPETLAFTGAEILQLGSAGLIVLAIGAALTVAGRRRSGQRVRG